MSIDSAYAAEEFASEMATEAPITAVAAILSKLEPGLPWEDYLDQAHKLVALVEEKLREPRRKRDLARSAKKHLHPDLVDRSIAREDWRPQSAPTEAEFEQAEALFIEKYVKGDSQKEKIEVFHRWRSSVPFDPRWILEPKVEPVLRDAYRQWRERETSRARSKAARLRKKNLKRP